MSDDKPTFNLINIDLSSIGDVGLALVNRVSDGVGGIWGRIQIRGKAKAEADAAITEAAAQNQISEMEMLTLQRMAKEGQKHEENIGKITAKAIPNLKADAKAEDIADDWIAHFLDKTRIVSNEEMQSLWANILACEANKPGTFSKKTVEIVATLDRQDADLFTRFCTFAWKLSRPTPLVFDHNDQIYADAKIDFEGIKHLDYSGLISFDVAKSYILEDVGRRLLVQYFDIPITIEFPKDENDFGVGTTIFTKAGSELYAICGAKLSEEFFSYVLETWSKRGLILSSPIPTECK